MSVSKLKPAVANLFDYLPANLSCYLPEKTWQQRQVPRRYEEGSEDRETATHQRRPSRTPAVFGKISNWKSACTQWSRWDGDLLVHSDKA